MNRPAFWSFRNFLKTLFLFFFFVFFLHSILILSMTRASALDSESRVHLLGKYLPLLLIWPNVPITFEKKLWFTFMQELPEMANEKVRKNFDLISITVVMNEAKQR